MASDLLVEVTRGPLVESVHRGHIAVVGADGAIRAQAGDPRFVSFFRSSAKPLQALAVVESGAYDDFHLTAAELAVACASHSAEQQHLETVQSLLSKAGLGPQALRCGVHEPYDEGMRKRLIQEGLAPSELHSNCSGKHAGMLAVCARKGWTTDDYYLVDHPLQVWLRQIAAEMADIDAASIVLGVDGCGVPVFGLSLYHMAYAWARLSAGTGLSAQRRRAAELVTRAMTAHPAMTSGTGKFPARLMEVGGGNLIAKAGAEGVFCVGHLKEGWALAVKVEDGNARATGPAVVAALQQLGALTDEQVAALSPFGHPQNRNARREIVGELRPSFCLRPAPKEGRIG